jgi:hypothetical protein
MESVDYEVIARWEVTGMLDNLPLWEKNELAILYDNTIRVVLSDTKYNKLEKKIDETFNMVNLPVVRRLYRRVGPFFDLVTLLSNLLDEVIKNIEYLNGEVTAESNPIVDFCKNFADNYEDVKTLSNKLSKEGYTIEVNKILAKLSEILLNTKMVNNITKNDNGWDFTYSESIKSEYVTRFWNQKTANSFLIQALSDLNKK